MSTAFVGWVWGASLSSSRVCVCAGSSENNLHLSGSGEETLSWKWPWARTQSWGAPHPSQVHTHTRTIYTAEKSWGGVFLNTQAVLCLCCHSNPDLRRTDISMETPLKRTSSGSSSSSSTPSSQGGSNERGLLPLTHVHMHVWKSPFIYAETCTCELCSFCRE